MWSIIEAKRASDLGDLGQEVAEEHRQRVLRFLDTSTMDPDDPMVKREGPAAARVCELSPVELRELIFSIRWLELYLSYLPE